MDKLKKMFERAFYGIDYTAIENPDTYTTDFIFFVANAKLNWMEEHADLQDKKVYAEFIKLQQIAFGMAGYAEMESGVYTKKDKEFKRLEKEFKKAWKLLGNNMTILW